MVLLFTKENTLELFVCIFICLYKQMHVNTVFQCSVECLNLKFLFQSQNLCSMGQDPGAERCYTDQGPSVGTRSPRERFVIFPTQILQRKMIKKFKSQSKDLGDPNFKPYMGLGDRA